MLLIEPSKSQSCTGSSPPTLDAAASTLASQMERLPLRLASTGETLSTDEVKWCDRAETQKRRSDDSGGPRQWHLLNLLVSPNVNVADSATPEVRQTPHVHTTTLGLVLTFFLLVALYTGQVEPSALLDVPYFPVTTTS